MDRRLLTELGSLLRPLTTRLANMVSRGVVQIVNDSKKLQLVQMGVLAGQTVEGRSGGAEHFQAYGFTSVPLEGAEGVVIFPNGDGEHPLLIAVSDRRCRPTAGQPGEVTVYNNTGAKIVMTKDGDIVATPAPGREVYIKSAGGTAEPLIKKSEFDAHLHTSAASGSPTSAPTVLATGTTKLQAE